MKPKILGITLFTFLMLYQASGQSIDDQVKGKVGMIGDRIVKDAEEGFLIRGTGFVLSPGDMVVTCKHVAEKCANPFFIPKKNMAIALSLALTDTINDIAIYNASEHIDVGGLNLANPVLGEKVRIFGYNKDDLEKPLYRLRGQVFFLGLRIKDYENVIPIEYLGFLANTKEGYSGSPILNESNEVVGMCRSTISVDSLCIVTQDAVPANLIRKLLESRN